MEMSDTKNCGILEAHGLLDDPLKSLRAMTPEDGEDECETCGQDLPVGGLDASHVLFSDKVPTGRALSRGAKLAAFITAKHLGHVAASRVAKNPNSENNIQAWLWTVNHAALATFLGREE